MFWLLIQFTQFADRNEEFFCKAALALREDAAVNRSLIRLLRTYNKVMSPLWEFLWCDNGVVLYAADLRVT